MNGTAQCESNRIVVCDLNKPAERKIILKWIETTEEEGDSQDQIGILCHLFAFVPISYPEFMYCGERTEFQLNNMFAARLHLQISIRVDFDCSIVDGPPLTFPIVRKTTKQIDFVYNALLFAQTKNQSQVTHKSQLFFSDFQRELQNIHTMATRPEKWSTIVHWLTTQNSMLNHDFSVSFHFNFNFFFFFHTQASTEFGLDEAKIAYNANTIRTVFRMAIVRCATEIVFVSAVCSRLSLNLKKKLKIDQNVSFAPFSMTEFYFGFGFSSLFFFSSLSYFSAMMMMMDGDYVVVSCTMHDGKCGNVFEKSIEGIIKYGEPFVSTKLLFKWLLLLPPMLVENVLVGLIGGLSINHEHRNAHRKWLDESKNRTHYLPSLLRRILVTSTQSPLIIFVDFSLFLFCLSCIRRLICAWPDFHWNEYSVSFAGIKSRLGISDREKNKTDHVLPSTTIILMDSNRIGKLKCELCVGTVSREGITWIALCSFAIAHSIITNVNSSHCHYFVSSIDSNHTRTEWCANLQ